jgi:hypothetical protein
MTKRLPLPSNARCDLALPHQSRVNRSKLR